MIKSGATLKWRIHASDMDVIAMEGVPWMQVAHSRKSILPHIQKSLFSQSHIFMHMWIVSSSLEIWPQQTRCNVCIYHFFQIVLRQCMKHYFHQPNPYLFESQSSDLFECWRNTPWQQQELPPLPRDIWRYVECCHSYHEQWSCALLKWSVHSTERSVHESC